MELRTDFYSAGELAVSVDLGGEMPFSHLHTNELFLFAAFTLRHFSNLGQHPVAGLLAALLETYEADTAQSFAQGTYEFPSRLGLDVLIETHGLRMGLDHGVLWDQLLSRLPVVVAFKGQGKKCFDLTFPPMNMRLKGFGLLGLQVVQYSFRSVVAVFGYLAAKHADDQTYLNNLARTAIACGNLERGGGVSMLNQVALATGLMHEFDLD